jgi:hypothetical protein
MQVSVVPWGKSVVTGTSSTIVPIGTKLNDREFLQTGAA